MKILRNYFKTATLLDVANRELAEAELAKLTAQTGQEYAASLVAYNTSRIERLRTFIQQQS